MRAPFSVFSLSHTRLTLPPTHLYFYLYSLPLPPSPSPANTNRNTALATAARDLEFGAHQLARSAGGYRDRAVARARAVRVLGRCPAAWSQDPTTWPLKEMGGQVEEEVDADEVREVADVVRKACARARKSMRG